MDTKNEEIGAIKAWKRGNWLRKGLALLGGPKKGGGLSIGQIGEELHFSNCPATMRIRFSLRNPQPNVSCACRSGEFHVENAVYFNIYIQFNKNKRFVRLKL